MRCFKCCGRQPWTFCGLLINRENKILFMALLGQINKLLPDVDFFYFACTTISHTEIIIIIINNIELHC